MDFQAFHGIFDGWLCQQNIQCWLAQKVLFARYVALLLNVPNKFELSTKLTHPQPMITIEVRWRQSRPFEIIKHPLPTRQGIEEIG